MTELTLPSGVTISVKDDCSEQELNNIKRKLGLFVPDGVHYESSTNGIVKIADMHTNHIKNAIRKLYRTWVDALSTTMTNKEFLQTVANGPNVDPTLLGLVQELAKRKE